MTSDLEATGYRFGCFFVDPASRQLLIDGLPSKIGARAFDTLIALIDRRNRMVSKSELFAVVWPGLAVEDGNLPVQIFALRKILGSAAIATVPGRGYQFVLPIDGPAPLVGPSDVHHPAVVGKGNLPLRMPELFGRDSDIRALSGLISKKRLITVVGPPGIGKTRLALAVADGRRTEEADGAWLVELAPVDEPDQIVSTAARALGLHTTSNPDALTALTAALAPKRLLLVLDNCEHVAEAAASLVAAVLNQAPNISVIVTSRAPLRLSEEHVYRLGALAIPPRGAGASAMEYGSVELFLARARSADEGFTLTLETLAAVIEICRRVDGIPFAIELAAARVYSLGVRSVSRMLDELLRLLVGGQRSSHRRHQTLSATMTWSYELLSEATQGVLDLLGTFVGGFSLRAAQALITDENIDEWEALEHLSTLVEHSLVVVDPGDPPRYRLLEITRAFSVGRLADRQALAAARRRHATAMITALGEESFQAPPAERIRFIAPEIHNLRTATTWAVGPDGDRALAVELMAETDFIWFMLGYGAEAEVLFKTVEPWVNASTQPLAAAKFWLSRSKVYSAAMDTAAAAALKAAAVFRKLGDSKALFEAMTYTAIQYSYAGDSGAARTAIAEAGAARDPTWPAWTRMELEFFEADVEYWSGDIQEARRRLLKSLEGNRGAQGDVYFGQQMRMLLVGCDVAERRPLEALKAADKLLAADDQVFGGSARAIVEGFRAAALAQLGDLHQAERDLREALPRIRQALGTLRTTCCHIAALLARQGRCADAARLLGVVDARRPGSPVLPPPNRSSYEDATSMAASALGSVEFENLKELGRTLSEDQAVALAFPGSIVPGDLAAGL